MKILSLNISKDNWRHKKNYSVANIKIHERQKKFANILGQMKYHEFDVMLLQDVMDFEYRCLVKVFSGTYNISSEDLSGNLVTLVKLDKFKTINHLRQNDYLYTICDEVCDSDIKHTLIINFDDCDQSGAKICNKKENKLSNLLCSLCSVICCHAISLTDNTYSTISNHRTDILTDTHSYIFNI